MIDSPADLAPLPGYPEPYAMLLATLVRQTGNWRHQLEEPTVEEIVWQPYPQGHSIGAMMLHIAEVESDWIQTVAMGRPMSAEDRELYLCEQTDPYLGKWPTPPREPWAYYVALQDRVRGQTLATVKEFGNPLEIRDAGWSLITLRWLFSHLIWHESYHGGQMVLLRALRAGLLGHSETTG